MSELFFTTGEHQPDYKKVDLHWAHKEQTIKELMALGVPVRPAEMFAIDFKTQLYIAQRNRLTPTQTASMMIDIVRQSYFREGKWIYT